MKSVVQRIKEIKQPIGGYINPKLLKKTEFNDYIELREENISAGLIGIAVDYLTRYINSGNKEEAFKISLMGAEKIKASKKANQLLNDIIGLDNKSIVNACKLCGYDVCYRAGIAQYKNVNEINPDGDTIFNIRTMVNRGIEFFEQYGPVVKDGITFGGGYTPTIVAGDADFITEDTLWDFKVSTKEPTKDHTLQLIVYYLLGLNSYECDFSKIKKIGIFNPRKNTVYEYEIDNIDKTIIDEINRDVIGYENASIKVDNYNKKNEEILTLVDIMKIMQCSRHMVMKYFYENDLPLKKEKNKYFVNKNEFFEWLDEMKRIQEEQERNQLIIAGIIIIIPIVYTLFILIK